MNHATRETYLADADAAYDAARRDVRDSVRCA